MRQVGLEIKADEVKSEYVFEFSPLQLTIIK
jgi:hypothetical protein